MASTVSPSALPDSPVALQFPSPTLLISATLLLLSAFFYATRQSAVEEYALNENPLKSAERKRIRSLPLPPTPKGLPLVGNTFQLPKEYIWRYFSEKSHELKSPIVHLYVGGNHFVVLNDKRTAVEVLDKQGAKSSGRPKMVIWNRMSHDMRFGGLNHTDPRFKVARRAATDVLGGVKNGESEALQTAESMSLMLSLISKPAEFGASFDRYALSVVFSLAFGLSIPSTTSHIYQVVHQMMTEILASLDFGSWFVDFFPGVDDLEWLNEKWEQGWWLARKLMPWRTICENWFQRHSKAYMSLGLGSRTGGKEGYQSGYGGGWNEVREDLDVAEAGEVNPEDRREILDDLTKQQKENEVGSDGRDQLKTWANVLKDPEAKGLRGHEETGLLMANLFEAGADTTAIGFRWTVLAALLHPEATKKARAELDSVVGLDRLPKFADKENLPYVNSFVLEVARWRPIVPLGIPHAATDDIEFDGYCIPKGSTIFANLWEINRDPALFPESTESFIPDRHLIPDPEHEGKQKCYDAGGPMFGYGRRICPGEALARRSLFIVTAMMLWAFDFERVEGAEEIDSFQVIPGATPLPKPFPVKIVPRDLGRVEVLRREWNSMPKSIASLLPSL